MAKQLSWPFVERTLRLRVLRRLSLPCADKFSKFMLTPHQKHLGPKQDFPQKGVPLPGFGPELRSGHAHGIDLSARGFT